MEQSRKGQELVNNVEKEKKEASRQRGKRKAMVGTGAAGGGSMSDIRKFWQKKENLVEKQDVLTRKRKATEQVDHVGDEEVGDGVPKKLCVGYTGVSVKSETKDKFKIKNIKLKTFSFSNAEAVGEDQGGQVAAQGAGVGGGRRGAVQNVRAENFPVIQACTGLPDSAAAGRQNVVGQCTSRTGRN